MSTNVILNGATYSIPSLGDSNWGDNVSNYLIAIASSCLQKSGGTFTLTAELDIGATYGLKTAYVKSRAANPASAGILRLGNNESIKWRNAANNADLDLTLNASNLLQFNGATLATSGTGSIVNADIAAAAAIDLSKLAAVTANKVLVSDASGFISASSVTTTTLGYLDATSSIQTQLNGKQASGSYALTTDKLSQFAATTSAELAGVISDETGTGSLVFSNTPTLVTPALGVATATSINGTTIPSSKTLVVTTDKLSALAATSSSELAGVISDETGSGSLVFANTPTLVTPALGAATGTSLVLGGSLGASALLDVQSTSKGFLEPRMTQTQRDAISTPAAGLQIYNTDTNKLNYYNGSAWAEVGSGSTGGINYIIDYDGSAIGSWVTYADAAGTSPVDGTGGSPTVTYAVSSSTAIRGASNFLFTHGASNQQGQGFSYVMAIDPADRGKVIQLTFNYLVASGTYADNDLSVWFYDVTNSALIQPAPYLIKNSGIIEKFFSEVQVPSTCASLRVIVHVSSSTATAYTMRFDDWNCGPQAKLYGSPITDPVSKTFTLTNVGNATVSGTVARIGSKGLFSGTITIGSSLPTGNITLNLPSGYAMSTTGYLDGSISAGIGANTYTASPYANSTTTVVFAGPNTSTWNATTPATWSAGNTLTFNIQVDIVGWSSSQIMSSDANTKIIAASSTNTVQSLTTAIWTTIQWTTKVYDSDGIINNSTYLATITSPGYYRLSGHIGFQNNATGTRAVGYVKNGGTIVPIVGVPGLNDFERVPYTTEQYLLAGDTITIQAYQSSGGALSTADSVFSISKISGPSQILASNSVSARYTGAPPTGTLTNSFNVVTYGTKANDSNSAYSSGSYIIPISGDYSISASARMAATYAANNQAILSIFNGSTEIARGVLRAGGVITDLVPNVNAHSIKCLAEDVITIKSYNDATTPSFSGTAESNYFSIVRTGNY